MSDRIPSITQCLVVPEVNPCIEFLKEAFAGTAKAAIQGPLAYVEVRIGNGAVAVVEAQPSAPAAVHLYVEDADATYAQALLVGAQAIYPVADQPWGDRQGAVKDAFGNHWYIAQANWTPGPEGIPSVQPFLHLRRAHEIVPFLETAFGAESLGVAKEEDGTVLHGTIQIGDATLEISEASDEFPPMPSWLLLRGVEVRAAAGATPVEGGVQDAWGNRWLSVACA